MNLNELRENPNNPSKCTDEQLNRLVEKLKRVPLGLKAMRIAYVTDDPDGGKMVISGNKRLRALKLIYGEDAELPDENFQDVTDMSPAQRHEFIVTANTSDGEWDLSKLFTQYDMSELDDFGIGNLSSMVPSTIDMDDVYGDAPTSDEDDGDDESVTLSCTCSKCGKAFTYET